MIFIALVAAAAAVATWALGWWGVALVAIAAGVVVRAQAGRPWRVALACLLGWTLLLAVDAVVGPFGNVAKTVAGAMNLPVFALLVVTLLFPALIGWSGATLGALGSTWRERAVSP